VPRRLERIADALDPVHTGRVDRDAPAAARSDARELTAFYTDRARRLAEAGKDGDAIDDLRRALFLAPYDAGALLLLARLHLRAGRAPEAADTARVAVWSEETAAGRVVLGQALIEAGDVAGARAEAERALVLDPESAEARALLASAAGAGAR
jgi:Tfp pilus assembly protein PilF